MIFSWNRANVEHIARHGITPFEAEEVVRAAQKPWPTRAPDGKWKVWGQTRGGRYLQVIFILPTEIDVDPQSLSMTDLADWMEGKDVVLYVIHARELVPDERRQFRRRTRP